MSDHKPCYGKMFPNVLPSVEIGVHSGKVFSFQIENFGLARGPRSVSIDNQKWERLSFSEFDHCYKLSMGVLTLQNAIREA